MKDQYSLNLSVQKKLSYLFELINKIYKNGDIDIFSRLFQTDYRILKYLKDFPGSHPSVLAEKLNVTRSNIAANLRILEDKGLIERKLDKSNRRQIYVYNTSKAETLLKQCDVRLSKLFSDWFEILGEEEVSHLIKILELSSDPKLISDEIKNFDFGF